MQLQREAGNLAVTRALGSSSPSHMPTARVLQLETPAPTAAPAPAQGRQLAAVWNAQVVIPLARAADRVGRAAVDLPGARADLEGALRTITTLRNATGPDDPNRLRYEIIERRARGVLELVLQHQGVGKDQSQLSEDTRKIRAEAVELGPLLEHRPQPRASAANGGDEQARGEATGGPPTASVPSAAGGSGPDTGPASGSGPMPTPEPRASTPGEAPGPGSSAGPTTTEPELDTIADLWNFLVVRRLWTGQRELAQGSKYATIDYSTAQLYILEFLQATPEGHPNRLKLMRLEAGVETIAGQTAKFAPDLASDPIADQAVNAWNSATAMLEYIPGAQSSNGPGEAPAAAQEPTFTWERPPTARSNDTELERP